MKPLLTVIANIYIALIQIKDQAPGLIIYLTKRWLYASISHPTGRVMFVVFPIVMVSFGHNLTLSGSSAIAIRRPTEIIVGADSKGVYSGAVTSSILVCKIHQFKNTFFVQTGLYQYLATGFDVVSIASEACRTNGSLAKQVQTFESLMRDRLTETMKYIKTNDPQYYKNKCLNKRVIDVAFWGIEGRVPLLYTRFFNVADSPSGISLVTIQKQDCPVVGYSSVDGY